MCRYQLPMVTSKQNITWPNRCIIKTIKSEIRISKYEMVRLAVRQAHGHELRRMAHHPERTCREPQGRTSRRTISKLEYQMTKTFRELIQYLQDIDMFWILDLCHSYLFRISYFELRISRKLNKQIKSILSTCYLFKWLSPVFPRLSTGFSVDGGRWEC